MARWVVTTFIKDSQKWMVVKFKIWAQVFSLSETKSLPEEDTKENAEFTRSALERAFKYWFPDVIIKSK